MKEKKKKKVIEEITFERMLPTTTRGDAIMVKLIYTSFDKSVIDLLQERLYKEIGLFQQREIEVNMND